ncbi:MAG: HAMP domain-containing protein [Ruminococcaceae bacterium]|nr:HAMP domain-containing protein [Oscillospiraceae bacterium]
MKNIPIRLKMATMYVNMSIFTLPILIVSYIQMRNLNAMAPGAGDGIISTFTWVYPVFIVVYLAVTFALGRKLTGALAFPLKDLDTAAHQIAQGDVNVQVTYQSKDEIGRLADEFRSMVAGIHVQADELVRIAQGDYTGSINIRSSEDSVNKAISQMLDKNNEMISQLRTVARQVAEGSAQIAAGAQSLATGSTQQAASIEAFSASLAGVQSQVEGSTEMANKTYEDSQQAGLLMQRSAEYMGQLTGAMQEINDSSQNIAKVIKVIDDIAFQTNILALNAAVEAARAGEHGKGFAVVADEVRNLASKSAEAAKETAALIENSVQKVATGNEIVEKTGQSLTEAGALVSSNAETMQQLREASMQQSASVGQVAEAIGEISQVVQANSASAEESAATAQELSAQSAMLQQIVSAYKLRDGAGHSGGYAALPARR